MKDKTPASRPIPEALCPICGRLARGPDRPFCSRRCADLDLHRWLGGRYVIETDEPVDPDMNEDEDL